MSSIRPLATITVLALVGVFLYMKINETEPPLPEGVEDWTAATAIEFDMGDAGPGAVPQLTTLPSSSEAPAYSPPAAIAPGSAAPAFGASNVARGGGSSTGSSWSDAPASSPGPNGIVSTPSPKLSTPSPNISPNLVNERGSVSTEAESFAAPRLPDLPPLPALPPTPYTTPQAGVSADATSSNTASSPYARSENRVSPTADTGQPTFPPLTSARVATESPRSNVPNPSPAISSASTAAQPQPSPYSATRLAVQAALDRGEYSQALLLLSDWYGDPSLSPSEAAEVNSLLSQLAGSVIYSTEHRLVPSYMVQAGERLETIAEEHGVPWQLLAKINGITSADQLQPGQKLKVVRGPFSALIDLSQRKLTLMLDRRYAGQFSLDVDLGVTVEEGQWEVNQKLLTPANISLPGGSQPNLREERSLMLSSASSGATQVAILRGSTASGSLADPAGRVLRLNPTDAADVFDILSLGSKVVIRR